MAALDLLLSNIYKRPTYLPTAPFPQLAMVRT
jgi:hypothetical protein